VTVFLNNNISNCLSDKDRETCDKALTEDELFAALKKLPSGKVPGIDGLPAEFFREFWDELKLSFFELSQACFNDGCLPESMRTDIITLIYKKEARDDIRNYRPISLLCFNYKIIAKAFAERMKMVLPNIIHKDQTGFLKDRYIGENITLFLDTQEHMRKSQKAGYAFLADSEKAYDRVDRNFIAQSLSAFGFGPNFISWFQLLHKDSIAQVIINGFLTDPFDIQSGVRQGCPWAPFLFLIGIEPLACALRSDASLEGLLLPNGERILYSGYADDTTLFVSNLQDLDNALKIFDQYSSCNGMKLNLSKSWMVPLGTTITDVPSIDSRFKWLTPSDQERLLGVPVTLTFDPDSWLGM
jgi:hypothetical protein